MYQVLWSACFCQLFSRVTFHVSSTLVGLFLSVIQPSYLPCIKYFDRPVSVSCPVYRNVNDEECLSVVSVSNGCASLLLVQVDVHTNQSVVKSSYHYRKFSGQKSREELKKK